MFLVDDIIIILQAICVRGLSSDRRIPKQPVLPANDRIVYDINLARRENGSRS